MICETIFGCIQVAAAPGEVLVKVQKNRIEINQYGSTGSQERLFYFIYEINFPSFIIGIIVGICEFDTISTAFNVSVIYV